MKLTVIPSTNVIGPAIACVRAESAQVSTSGGLSISSHMLDPQAIDCLDQYVREYLTDFGFEVKSDPERRANGSPRLIPARYTGHRIMIEGSHLRIAIDLTADGDPFTVEVGGDWLLLSPTDQPERPKEAQMAEHLAYRLLETLCFATPEQMDGQRLD
jgi:hypothetical protein